MPVCFNFGALGKDLGHGHCQNSRTCKAVHAKLPCPFSLSRTGVHKRHKKHNINRRGNIEDLEAEIPQPYPVGERAFVEEIEVSCKEDEDVEDLGN